MCKFLPDCTGPSQESVSLPPDPGPLSLVHLLSSSAVHCWIHMYLSSVAALSPSPRPPVSPCPSSPGARLRSSLLNLSFPRPCSVWIPPRPLVSPSPGSHGAQPLSSLQNLSLSRGPAVGEATRRCLSLSRPFSHRWASRVTDTHCSFSLFLPLLSLSLSLSLSLFLTPSLCLSLTRTLCVCVCCGGRCCSPSWASRW